MKRLIVLLVIAVAVGLFGVSSLPGSSSATHELPTNWDPLSATCFDVNGDGVIDLPNDILGVIQRFNARWGDDNYALVYDVTGGGVIDLPNDVLGVILAHHPDSNVPNPDCPLVDTQVIRAAAALLPYQDCQDAVADGYSPSGLYVGNMGIHISKNANMRTEFDPDYQDPITGEYTHLAEPFGLVCTEDPNVFQKPDNLIGAWYIIPVASTGSLYGLSGPFQPDTVPPDGFDTGEDFIEYSGGGAQAGWHTHENLCVGFNPAFLNEQGPDGTQQSCQAIGGVFNISLYGWMLHLYTFVPNPDGRFMRWNVNPDFPRCGYEANTGPC